MNNPYQQNPFAVLKLSPSATNAEVIEKAEELEDLVYIGEITSITNAQVIQAKKQLLLPDSRIKAELFCYCLDTNDAGELQTLLQQWSTNPLRDSESQLVYQEEWSEEEIQRDFSEIEVPDIELDADGSRFDNIQMNLKKAQYLMELPVPIIDFREEEENGSNI